MPPAPRLAAPTSHDVAQEAGLSQSTVSRALRGDARVTAETRERVLAAAQRLGYTPSALGRHLVQRSTQTIGMVVTEISNPFYPNLIAPLHDEQRRRAAQWLGRMAECLALALAAAAIEERTGRLPRKLTDTETLREWSQHR